MPELMAGVEHRHGLASGEYQTPPEAAHKFRTLGLIRMQVYESACVRIESHETGVGERCG